MAAMPFLAGFESLATEAIALTLNGRVALRTG